MRFKVLALFVAIQALSFGLWTSQNAESAETISETSHAAAKSLNGVHFSALNTYFEGAKTHQAQVQQTVTSVLNHLPKNHVNSVKNVVLDFDPEANRGLGGKQMVVLRATLEPMELAGVLVHEVGHNVDLIALKAPKQSISSDFKDGDQMIFAGDPSVDFYSITWKNATQLKRTASNLDFVSGYAMQDPFEDFAETYAYYVLHHNEFKAKVASSADLYAKYRFMKYRVFGGQEFGTGNALAIDPLARPWDVTVLNYDLMQFINNG